MLKEDKEKGIGERKRERELPPPPQVLPSPPFADMVVSLSSLEYT